ncbi:MAG: (d)CMP kinase [Pseudomonadota bacterium]
MGSETNKPFVIALDGPAASGKGTLARALADIYDFEYLDTGILYRGVAWLMLDNGLLPKDEETAAATARGFSLDAIKDAPLRSREVGAAASVVAANKNVRAALLDFQRTFAVNPPNNSAGAILDGRDIGTVVCPDATVKFFVSASLEQRAKRRWLELKEDRPEIQLADVLADLKERDTRDASRADAPMIAADDAELIDTSDLAIDAVIAAARCIIDDIFERSAD